MEWFTQTIIKLCTLVCLCAICQQLLPSNEMRGYVRLVCGLLLLHMMLSQTFAQFGVLEMEAVTLNMESWIQMP